ncbi:MAG: hypothetical protein ACRBCJ_01105 [Hyphomicrobiaceae bacterium]
MSLFLQSLWRGFLRYFRRIRRAFRITIINFFPGLWRILAYYGRVVARAWSNAFQALGISMTRAMQSILIWALATYILWRVPWQQYDIFQGVAPNYQDEIPIGVAAVLAILILFGVVFIFNLIYAPVELDAENRKIVREVQDAIEATVDAERVIQILSELHREGRLMYGVYDDPPAWESKMKAWSERVEKILKAEFSAIALHEFRKPGSNFSYTTDWEWEPYDSGQNINLKGKYANRISALDDLVRETRSTFIGDKSELSAISDRCREVKKHD